MRGRTDEPTWERPVSRRSVRQPQSGLTNVIDSLNQLSEINQMAMASLVEGVGRMMLDMAGTINQPREVSRGVRFERQPRHRHDCDCDCDDCRGGCRRDDCGCRCCIGDVDLVVYTRIGERRVVPIVIENPRRREKEITLELSPWTTRSGKPAQVNAQIMPPTSFTLQPCEEHETVIIINVVGDVIGNDNPDNPPGSTVPPRLQDLDECQVVYADLRVVGCEIRPIRIALAILPWDCGAYEIDCGCSCC